MTITGTSHFVSWLAACDYYRDYGFDSDDVNRKIAEGEIHIGKPEEISINERLTIIDGGKRYAIESDQ